jgi:hypothetical protein
VTPGDESLRAHITGLSLWSRLYLETGRSASQGKEVLEWSRLATGLALDVSADQLHDADSQPILQNVRMGVGRPE